MISLAKPALGQTSQTAENKLKNKIPDVIELIKKQTFTQK